MRNFHFLIIILFYSTASFSQKVDLEIHAGLVGSIFKGNEDELLAGGDFVRRYSGTASLLVGIPINDLVRIRTGLGYSSRGSMVQSYGMILIAGGEMHPIKVNYIEVPFLLSLGPETINLLFGPQLSIITKSDVEGIKNNEFGLKYGLGIDAGHFVMRVLFYNGFSNMINSSELEMKNNYFSVAAGWKLIRASSATGKKKEKDTIHRVLD